MTIIFYIKKQKKAEEARSKMSELVSRMEVDLVQKKVDLINTLDRFHDLEMDNNRLKMELKEKEGVGEKKKLKDEQKLEEEKNWSQ